MSNPAGYRPTRQADADAFAWCLNNPEQAALLFTRQAQGVLSEDGVSQTIGQAFAAEAALLAERAEVPA